MNEILKNFLQNMLLRMYLINVAILNIAHKNLPNKLSYLSNMRINTGLKIILI